MDNNEISQVTEFPPFEQETAQSGVSTFLNKLWKLPMFSPTDSNENSGNKSTVDESDSASNILEPSNQEDEEKPEQASYAVEYEGRSLPNVLRRISSLIAMGSGGGTKYADTELARYWMPDDISRECYECASRFSALRRRHHCRVCGQIFCARCCNQRVPGQIFGCAGDLRVCNYCCNIVLTYLREHDLSGEVSPDLRTLQENLQVRFPEKKMSQTSNAENFMFDRDQEERNDSRTSQREALEDIFRRLVISLPLQQQRYRLVRYTGVWRGGDMMQWIMDNTNNKTSTQATAICHSLLLHGFVECATEMSYFADYALYRPSAMPQTSANESPEDRGRLTESVSSYCLDLNLGESSARLTKASKEEKTSPSSEEEAPILHHDSQSEADLSRDVLLSGSEHLKVVARQWAARLGLSASWAQVLLSVCATAAGNIAIDIHSSDIDIRNYVQIKKVPDGSPQDSCVVNGVVLSKNVAHRAMPQKLSNPSILLLDCSVAYQRGEGKHTSLEPVLMQEQEYLNRCAARIIDLRPKLVLARGSVARSVQLLLAQESVSLATGVSERGLRRIARCTGGELVASVDARIALSNMGKCQEVFIDNENSKTLMVLENCAKPHLGCTIILRGGSLQELVRVKKVARLILLACYNWKLEKSFLADIEADLPKTGMDFVDDDEKDDVTSTIRNKQSAKSIDDSDDDVFAKESDKKSINNEALDKNEDAYSKTKEESDSKVTEVTEDKSKISEVDDPLNKTRYLHKTASDRTLSCRVPIQDFSDPLHASVSQDDVEKVHTVLKADDTRDRWWMDMVLSMSPNVKIPAPYFESEAGRKCALRRYFKLARPIKAPPTPRVKRKCSDHCKADEKVKEVHPFIKNALTLPADDPKVRAAIANFRATGYPLPTNTHKPDCPLYKLSIVKKKSNDPEVDLEKSSDVDPLDPLAPENHQKLSLMLFSYSNKSPNVPDFCVNPWTAIMEMYGRHDISLGAFLEKYCFNTEYKCPSNNCNIPMNQHVRKFVHDDVCITITCNTVGSSNADKVKEKQNNQIVVWTRCDVCGATGRARRLARTSIALSLACYVRSRVHATRYVRANVCNHPLHAHAHMFVCNLTTACFRYSKITPYHIRLPPHMIYINYDIKQIRETLLSQLNDLVSKGHEMFTSTTESEADKDYTLFKQHMEQIHVALTSSHLQEYNTNAAVIRSLWNVSDRIINGEKMLRDAQEKWANNPKSNKSLPETSVEEKSDIEDSSGDGNDSSGATTYVFSDNHSKEEKEQDKEEDEERSDKKTVRQILSQLLSNNQQSNQNGIIISTGVLPIVVMAGEIGSVIAATLASYTYLRTLHSNQNDQEEVDTKEGKDKTDGDKSKTRSSDHIEVLLKDGLVCRVYYAAQFLKLRHMFLCPLSANPHISGGDDGKVAADDKCGCGCEDAVKTDYKTLCEIEEGFIRSLAHCVPWAARGGKSGSTFCKSVDDRYVLKEMTKPEWQQFLEFAPHYFNYVITCRQNNWPCILARIVGVYSVGGAGNGVLVVENVWYTGGAGAGAGAAAAAGGGARYDLKGSARPRLPPAARAAEPVHTDTHLMQVRWEQNMFVGWHTGRVLFSCLERDTMFLAQHCVMDYSVLLGVEDNTLVFGIVDYIRTFTWDKKLEHLVKKNLGSGQPTVVSPEQYRKRFLDACRKYFPTSPSHWQHLYALGLPPT